MRRGLEHVRGTGTPSAPLLPAGTRIADRYTVLRIIGSGGMGTVYEIESTNLGNRLALKVLSPKFTRYRSVVARFHQEAKFQATITHPGITRVFELVQEDDLLGIVMEFVQAPTLRDVMDEGPTDPSVVRGVVRELLSTLGACHDHGIAHRDLKPENIFVFRDDHGGIRCKLADFGVAKLLAPGEDEPALTRGHSFVGTPMYASPEQVERSASIDGRSDLYSLGVVTWEMLTGLEPYADLETTSSIQVAVVTEDLPPLPHSVPDDLRALVMELTRKEREHRPKTAQAAMGILASPRGNGSPSVQAVPPVPPVATDHEDPLLRPIPKTPLPRAEPTFQFAAPERPQPSPTPAGSALVLRETVPPPIPSPHDPNVRRQARDQRLQAIETAGVLSRLGARFLDELSFQLLVLSCVGIVLYPLVVPLRGAFSGRSMGSRVVGLQVFSVYTGRPASFGQMLLRNLVDLFSFQMAIAAIVWPVGWYWYVPIFGLAWLVIFGTAELVIAAIHPEGRRIADFIAGTRVGVRL